MDAIGDHVPFPNGESRNGLDYRVKLDCRVKEAVNKSLDHHGGDILFVSHGLVYQSLLKITGIPVHHIHNGALIQFKPQDGLWIILDL